MMRQNGTHITSLIPTPAMPAASYGAIVLQPRVQLITALPGAPPLLLACTPLPVDLVAHMLYPPPGALAPAPDQLFRTWGALPARTQLSGGPLGHSSHDACW